MPEFAFAGRSNVGKSSLINYLCNRRKLAKTGATPGKTRLINLFHIDQRWSLVDLPGYGYAKVSKTEREVFRKMIMSYLTQRSSLARVFVLIDANIPPQKSDQEFIYELGSQQVPLAIVFTKSDRPRQNELQKNKNAFEAIMKESWEELPPIFLTSASKRMGRDDLLNYIELCLYPTVPPR